MVEPVECLLCFEGYSAQEKAKNPVVLSCGHTVCTSCYRHVIQRDNASGTECPVCKQIDKFSEPVLNLSLLAYISLNRDAGNTIVDRTPQQKEKESTSKLIQIQKDKQYVCAECKTQRPATDFVYCHDCCCLLCKACENDIHQFPLFAKHKRVPVTPEPESEVGIDEDGAKFLQNEGKDEIGDLRECATGIFSASSLTPADIAKILEENSATLKRIKESWCNDAAKCSDDIRSAFDTAKAVLNKKCESLHSELMAQITDLDERRSHLCEDLERLEKAANKLGTMIDSKSGGVDSNEMNEFWSCLNIVRGNAQMVFWRPTLLTTGFDTIQNIISSLGAIEVVSIRDTAVTPVLSVGGGIVGANSCSLEWGGNSTGLIRHVSEEGAVKGSRFELMKQQEGCDRWIPLYEGSDIATKVTDLASDMTYSFRVRPAVVDEHGFKRVGCWSNVLEVRTASREQMMVDRKYPTLSNTVKIDLSNLQLVRCPTAVWLCGSTATELNLSFNKLSSLPEHLASLTKLSVLQLDRNQLKSLPQAILQLTNLRSLYLRRNQIEVLPEELFSMPKLVLLYITHNPCEAVYKGRTLLSGKVVR